MAATAGKRILVVEDEPLVAMLLEDMLDSLGFEVVGPALRLERALELARSEPLDGAILDVNLGGGRSDPVADALDRRGIPYLFATGYGTAGGDARRAAVPLLQKPYREADLEAALERLLG